MLTAMKGNTALCDYLLRNGADVALVDVKGSFLLIVLIRPPDDDSWKVLYIIAVFSVFFTGPDSIKSIMGPKSCTKSLLIY